MKKTTIAFAGAGGYADYCLGLLLDYCNTEDYQLVGIIDPYGKRAPRYSWFCEQGIPMFDTVEEFYREHTADVLYIASPIPMHKPQCEVAFANHSHVMCEKPLTPFVEDAEQLERLAKKQGCQFGIGFQWSYSPVMLAAKQDILNGKYGKPVSVKAYISWKRFDDYYQTSSWKGRIRDAAGNWVMDSIATNATAHYLHNLFFMLGDSLETSLMPQTVKAAVYRGKEIESFDTCITQGEFEGGARFLYLATHSGDEGIEPMVEYRFEKGTISLILGGEQNNLTGRLKDGTVIDYGCPSGREQDAAKLQAIIAAAQGKGKLTCTVPTILPHLKVCNAMFDRLEIADFPKGLVFRTIEPAGSFVKGLAGQLLECYRQEKTPMEMGYSWAVEEIVL